MGKRIVIGNTAIEVADQELSTGYQEGYLRFTELYHDKPLRDTDVYGFLARTMYDYTTSDRYRAGYIVGWCAALHGQGHPGATIGYYVADARQKEQVTV